MSVFMTLRVKADPTALERYAGEHGDAMRSLSDAAQSAGAHPPPLRGQTAAS